MKRTQSRFLILGLFITALSLRNTGAQSGQSPHDPLSAGPLEGTISVEKDKLSLGQEIPIQVIHKNLSERSIRILNLTQWAYPLTFEVLDSGGRSSVTCRAPRLRYEVDDAKDFVVLEPGNTLSKVVDINPYFIFTEPDTYQVKAYYSGFFGLPQTSSNIIRVTLYKVQD